MIRRAVGVLGAIAVVLVLVGTAAAASPAGGTVNPPPSPTSSVLAQTPTVPGANSTSPTHSDFGTNAPVATTVLADERALGARGLNPALIHPPNLHQAPSLASSGGMVTPLYSIAPAPMGEGYFGLSNTTGHLRATTVNTTSLAGFYSTGDPLGTQTEEFEVPTGSNFSDVQPAFDSYGAQLNSVITNVTIFGHTSLYNRKDIDAPTGCPGYDGNPQTGRAPCPNEFWLQNYIEYVPATHAMQIGDEVWNFSNPSASWGSYNPSDPADRNTLVGFGSIEEGLYFLTNTASEYGPTIYVAYPYTMALYLNVTRGPCHTDTVPGSGVPSCSAGSSTVSTTAPVNEIFFNYSVWKSPGAPCLAGDVCHGDHVCPAEEPYAGIVCGEYDDIFFNSVNPTTPSVGVPIHGPHGQIGSAAIEANGTAYDPVGLTNDFEFDYGIGSDDGDTNGVVYQDGTVAVDYCPTAHTELSGACAQYSALPAATDFGGETGETSTGEVAYWAPQSTPGGAGIATPAGSPVAHLVTGPALLEGLWNLTGLRYPMGAGAHSLSYARISPANAWVGIAPGAAVRNQADFQVAPTFGWFSYWKGSGGDPRPTTLGANLFLPSGVYTVEVLLGGYAPQVRTVDLTTAGQAPTIALSPDPGTGVYTPLWAFSASDLANISTNGGAAEVGTVAHPYGIESATPTIGAPFGVRGSLAWLFSNTNDYLYPVWIGEFLNATSVYAESSPAASFFMQYPSWQVPNFHLFDLPSSNDFPLYFDHVQHFTLAHTPRIYSWASIDTVPVYSVVCNGCENVLVAENTFKVSSRGVEFFGGGKTLPGGTVLSDTRNVIWGNRFVPDPQPNFFGLYPPSTALVLRESFDRVYNNAFDAVGASLRASATADAPFEDWWNATCQPTYRPLASPQYPSSVVCEPLSYSQSLNGVRLTGSIVSSPFQGGNFWASFGLTPNPYGNIPFKARSSSPTGIAGIASPLPGAAGDYAPLLTETVYETTFVETGLPVSKSPDAFRVDIRTPTGGSVLWTNSTATKSQVPGCAVGVVCLSFYAPMGSYRFSVDPAKLSGSSFVPHPANGNLIVGVDSSRLVRVTFEKSAPPTTGTYSPVGPDRELGEAARSVYG